MPEIGGPVDLSDLRWMDAPALLVFWLLAIIVFLQFFTRYVLNDSLGWTEEVARYVLILLAFFGSVTATRKASHIYLEFLYRKVPLPLAKAMAVFAQLVTLGFYGALTWIGVLLSQRTRQKMISLDVPKSAVYWAVAASLAVMTLLAAGWLLRRLRQSGAEVVADIDQHSVID